MFITSLHIDNFRSLKAVQISDIRPVSIFHGDNNCGKSNILTILDLILRAKYSSAGPIVSDGPERQLKPKLTQFYTGRLDKFGDNFYFSSRDAIQFSVSIKFDDEEIGSHQRIIEAIEPERGGKGKAQRKLQLEDGHDKTLNIRGEFRYVDEQTCDVTVTLVDFNKHYILYRNDGKTIEHIPSLSSSSRFSLDTRVNLFESLMGQLTDSFQLLGTDRFLGSEKLSLEPFRNAVSAHDFKKFLFSLATHKTRHSDFQEINKRFGGAPFSFGEISFFLDQETKEIEIMIEKPGARLPISRMGCGLQQVLYLIASVVYNQKKIIGIEEIELNLSPASQKHVFEMIKTLVYKRPGIVNQVLVTSHSPYFQSRDDVKYFSVLYNETRRRTEVRTATQRALKKYFALGI